MEKTNPSKCFKSIIFFCSWQHTTFFERILNKYCSVDQRMIPAVDLNIFLYLLCDSIRIRTRNRVVRKWTLNHLAKFWVPLQSLKLCASFQQSLDIQATVDWRFTEKRVRDMIITYNHIFVFKMLFTFLNYQCDDEIKLSKLYHSSDSYRFDILNLILVFLV